MPVAKKRKVSLSLDEDLVEALEREEPGSLSPQVNQTLRSDFERKQQQRRLGQFLDQLNEQDGPLETPQDQAEVQRFADLLR
jgi:hypothetical protein